MTLQGVRHDQGHTHTHIEKMRSQEKLAITMLSKLVNYPGP